MMRHGSQSAPDMIADFRGESPSKQEKLIVNKIDTAPIKIPELIRQLQKIHTDRGDIRLCAYNHAGDYDDIGQVNLITDPYGAIIVIIEP